MSSRSRGNKLSKTIKVERIERTISLSNAIQKDQNSMPEKEKESSRHKTVPSLTAEQLRIAQMINSNRDQDKGLQEKINQVMQITGATNDSAVVALHDCDYDVNAAIDFILEGEDTGNWQITKKKKKSAAVSKASQESSSNKENVKVDTNTSKPRGGGPPRFRGRGGSNSQGGKDGNEGRGRGGERGGPRRGRMANGGPSYRGRGGRRRSNQSRMYDTRHSSAIVEPIETWSSPGENSEPQDNLKIDTWEEENSEDWEEWTGSLEQTTVFCPSKSVNQTPLSESPVATTLTDSAMSSTPPLHPSQSFPGSISQSQTIGLAALLQKSSQLPLGGLVSGGQQQNQNMGISCGTAGGPQISSSSGLSMLGLSEGLQAGVLGSGSSTTVPSSLGFSTSLQNSIFSNSGLHGTLNLSSGSAISSGAVDKGIGLSSQSLQSKAKPPKPKVTQSSKIPLSAVEMPEDAMAALDMKFSGLEFGTETFDFSSDMKTPVNSALGVSSSSVAPPSTKDLSVPVLSSSLSHKAFQSSNQSVSIPINNSVSNSGFGSSVSVGSGSQPTAGYGSSFSVSGGSTQYQNSFPSVSSHHSSMPSMTSSKPLSGLKDSSQGYSESSVSGSVVLGSSSMSNSGGGSLNASTGPSILTGSMTQSHAVQNSKPSNANMISKAVNSLGSAVPSGVQQQSMPVQHQVHQTPQQQPAHQMIAQHSQYVAPALQSALPPPFYGGLQQPMYSYEDLQLLHQRMPPMQAPTSLATGCEASLSSGGVYSVADGGKFRTDQNSPPVASTINQQGAATGGTYITATGSAPLPPFYMYHNMAAVPNTFTQYSPAIIPLPPNTHTGSSTNQFAASHKLPYGSAASYYDNLSQSADYKSAYSPSQSQSKPGSASSGSVSNAASELSGYKNHLSKSYDKQGFPAGTPPPFNLAGSGANPMTANAYPMFIQTMPAQHHSPLIQHQLHPDGSGAGSQRSGASTGQSKAGSKPPYGGSYWPRN